MRRTSCGMVILACFIVGLVATVSRSAVAPPSTDANVQKLSARLAELIKEVEALKGLEKRVAGGEKAAKDLQALQKRVDDLAKQLKDVPEALKKIDKIEDTLKKMTPTLQKVEDTLKKLEKVLTDLDSRLKKAEKAIGDLDPRLKKIESEIKVLSDEILKQAKENMALKERMKTLEEQMEKDRQAQEKRSREREQGREPGTIVTPAPYCPAPIGPLPPVPANWPNPGGCYILLPGYATGHYGECFPVLTMFSVPCPMPNYPGPLHFATPPIEEPAEKEKEKKSKDKEPETPPDARLIHQTSLRRLSNQSVAVEGVRTAAVKPAAAKKLDVSGLKATDANRLFWKGYGLYWQGKYSDALVLFEAAIQLDARDARYWYYRCLTEKAMGEPTLASMSLEKAVDLHVRGLPEQEKIGQALERIQGPVRMTLREALDRRRTN